MSTIILYMSGTLGDHLPLMALGQALQQRGYRVRMAINQAMHPYASRAGLEAVALTDIERGPEEAREHAWAWDHWNYPMNRPHPNAQPFDPSQFVTQARELVDVCRTADLLIATSIRALGYVAAQVVGLPWLTVSLNPSSFWQPGSVADQTAQRAGLLKEYAFYKPIMTRAFAQLGMSPKIPAWSRGWYWARHILLASSPYFSRIDNDQLQPQASIDLTGFWFYADPTWKDWQPDETLRRFCQRRPLVLTFSSQPLEDPRRVLQMHVAAAARLKLPLLVQRGWAGFSEADLPPDANPKNILFADVLPHDWLFAQAACAIQHGGIGSLARALRQGCPLLIEPYGNDQLYNAMRVVELGAGAAMHPFQMTVDGLVRVLSQQVLTPEFRRRAETVGAKLRTESGIDTACQLIETYLKRPAASPPGRPSYKAPVEPLKPRTWPIIIQRGTAKPDQTAIPKILHQTWKGIALPPDFAQYQQTWLNHHPAWTYYFWTDSHLREFLHVYYPWFLPIYDNYPQQIMRVDAVRYFLLHHYGGVYVDLDFEALRPIDPLLANQQLVVGLEPEAHLTLHAHEERGLTQIICNAFMASVPQHPFWEYLFTQLIAWHRTPEPVEATGPFMLTRAYESYGRQETVTVASAEELYPITSTRPWHELPLDIQQQVAQRAYAIHHWRGTWWREVAVESPQRLKVSLIVQGQLQIVSTMPVAQSPTGRSQTPDRPRISCLMITGDRPALAQLAIRCFQQQTYHHRELIIVDDGNDETLAQWVKQFHDDQITYVRLPTEQKTLGELRNIALAHARGDYIAQWDDDDLSDPTRLEVQMTALQLLQTDACFLERHQLWWPGKRRFAISCPRLWESSFICAKAKLPAYPALRQGEDTPVIERIVKQCRVVVLDFPQLYTYVFHGANTFPAQHWEAHWQTATVQYEGVRCDMILKILQNRLKLDLSTWITSDATVSVTTPHPVAQQASDRPQATLPDASAKISTTTPQAGERAPKILILTPVKDGVRFLPRFIANLKALTYPHDRIALAFLESDSVDHTFEVIADNLPAWRTEFLRVELLKRDYGYRSDLPRWESSQQFIRRSVLAKSRNYLVQQALQDEEWVLWVDVDVARWPQDVIEQLLAVQKEIVTPNCLSEQTGATFDYNTFKLKPDADQLDWSAYLRDGILQPPIGYGRLYLSDLRQHACVEVDAVGGTMLLIRADLHRDGLIFPPFSYKGYIETEGLAAMAKDMGYHCWGLPQLQIFHP